MKSESIIKGVSIGISTAILWSIVLNSKVVGIGVGICLGISLAISGSPISSKKDKGFEPWINYLKEKMEEVNHG